MSQKEEMINETAAEEMAEAAETAQTVETETEAQAAETTREQQLEEELIALDDKYKRVLAEYQNFRVRSQKEREAMYLDNVASTIAGFLPVIDTLERGMGQETDERFKKSLEMVIRQYVDCLDHFNVKAFGQRGDEFDPNLHNAVMMTEDEELKANQIADVLLKGYALGDRIIRHAMVRVVG